ncbi:MAG: serine hydrolase domain-containing protein [Pseudomonadota bacterium]
MVIRRVMIGLAALAVVAAGSLWALYRDRTHSVALAPEAFQGLTLDQRAALITGGAVSGGAPGAVLLLQVGDRKVVQTSGVPERRSAQPVRPDVLLRVASVGKIHTAAVVVELSRRGVIDLDQKISAYLPEDIIDGLPNGDTATVRQLLNHTAGIPTYKDKKAYLFDDWTKPLTLERALHVAKRQDTLFPAGERLSYSNMGYVLAGEIAERVSGSALADLIDEVLIEPLGLPATSYGLHNPPGADLHGYGTELRPWADTFIFWEHSAADAGIVASASDIAAVLEALVMPDGALRDLGAAMLEQPFGRKGAFQRSQGFAIRTRDDGTTLIGHNGDVAGYVTFAHALPDHDAIVVGHINCDCADLLAAMLDGAVEAVTAEQVGR